MPTLYLVATPIGNLGDITIRALEVLRAVDVIACEDTRHSLKLLSHFEIRKPLLACHAHDEERGAARILGLLAEGKNVAYVSDAGTPGLSDPGSLAVRRVREAGHAIVPLPGPSAFAALVSVAGVRGKSILFEGFLSPRPGRRRTRLGELLSRGEAFVVYESPHRIGKLLADLAAIEPDREVCLGREMTKIHEEIVFATASELLERFGGEGEGRGEFAVLVAPVGSAEAGKADEE
jgi:16S rRNA (cytidine1402-2'-O)-methyltransferase